MHSCQYSGFCTLDVYKRQGAGVNILISRLDGKGEQEEQHHIIKSGLIINFFHFLLFALIGNVLISAYFSLSTGNVLVKTQGILYSRIRCV